MSDRTRSKHLLLLGAGPGLGAAVARRFGTEGYRVTLLARTRSNLDSLADELRADGVQVDVLVADAVDPQAFRTILEDFAARAAPDVVVYNAALLSADDLITGSTERFVDAYSVDVVGAISAVQVFTPAMQGAGGGTVLFTGGGLALTPHPAYASVSLGKTALRAAAALLHSQLAPAGIHVTGVTIAGGIAPGTPFAPERIAEEYWRLHEQPRSDWSAELLYAPEQ